MKFLFAFGLLLILPGLGQELLRKPAVLILPDQIECKSGSGRYLTGEIAIRWDGRDPLTINIWNRRDPEKGGAPLDQVMVDLKVFDESGKELDREFFMSIPPMPDGNAVINPGEYKKLRFFLWNGQVVFPRPGDYCAVVTLQEAWTGKTNVVFTTNKRWFKVIEPMGKKGDL